MFVVAMRADTGNSMIRRVGLAIDGKYVDGLSVEFYNQMQETNDMEEKIVLAAKRLVPCLAESTVRKALASNQFLQRLKVCIFFSSVLKCTQHKIICANNKKIWLQQVHTIIVSHINAESRFPVDSFVTACKKIGFTDVLAHIRTASLLKYTPVLKGSPPVLRDDQVALDTSTDTISAYFVITVLENFDRVLAERVEWMLVSNNALMLAIGYKRIAKEGRDDRIIEFYSGLPAALMSTQRADGRINSCKIYALHDSVLLGQKTPPIEECVAHILSHEIETTWIPHIKPDSSLSPQAAEVVIRFLYPVMNIFELRDVRAEFERHIDLVNMKDRWNRDQDASVAAFESALQADKRSLLFGAFPTIAGNVDGDWSGVEQIPAHMYETLGHIATMKSVPDMIQVVCKNFPLETKIASEMQGIDPKQVLSMILRCVAKSGSTPHGKSVSDLADIYKSASEIERLRIISGPTQLSILKMQYQMLMNGICPEGLSQLPSLPQLPPITDLFTSGTKRPRVNNSDISVEYVAPDDSSCGNNQTQKATPPAAIEDLQARVNAYAQAGSIKIAEDSQQCNAALVFTQNSAGGLQLPENYEVFSAGEEMVVWRTRVRMRRGDVDIWLIRPSLSKPLPDARAVRNAFLSFAHIAVIPLKPDVMNRQCINFKNLLALMQHENTLYARPSHINRVLIDCCDPLFPLTNNDKELTNIVMILTKLSHAEPKGMCDDKLHLVGKYQVPANLVHKPSNVAVSLLTGKAVMRASEMVEMYAKMNPDILQVEYMVWPLSKMRGWKIAEIKAIRAFCERVQNA
jgi:hypothetical protein